MTSEIEVPTKQTNTIAAMPARRFMHVVLAPYASKFQTSAGMRAERGGLLKGFAPRTRTV